MPTHPLIPYVESPDGLGQDNLSNSSASMPGSGSSMTPHGSVADPKHPDLTLVCMFCDQTFKHQDELSPHVLTQHPTTLYEPAVLRVEAEFLNPGEKPWSNSYMASEEDGFWCAVCGQTTENACALETHMRKHKASFTYSCSICGRRFKEPWFLKNHMRTHGGKAGGKSKGQTDLETPVTINDVIQDQQQAPLVTPYKMCMVCGFFFPNKDGLAEHSKVHHQESEAYENECPSVDVKSVAESPLSQVDFLQLFELGPWPVESKAQAETSTRWIAQLDPLNTYQAWQLATKGKIAVGPSLAKDLGQDASSENEESCSDKEELGNIWSAGSTEKSINKDGLKSEMKSNQTEGENPSPEPSQKSLIRKDKPTHCQDCGKTFRTYHQLVLHSRVHKKDRLGTESPTTSIDGKLSSSGSGYNSMLERAEEGSEDGSEEGMTFHSDKSEDGFDKLKVKILAPSRECSYCGKTFRSNYYLNIHLRTHTGEKPYKCEYCDYAAAQKTSLRYHLDKRHKDKPYTEIPNKPVFLLPCPNDGKEKESTRNREDKQITTNPTKSWLNNSTLPGTTAHASVKQEAGVNSLLDKTVSPLAQPNVENGKMATTPAYSPAVEAHMKCPLPVNLTTEGKEIKEDVFDAPLNLSLKMSFLVSATSEPRNVISNACSSCAYKTLYPEVLLMHRKLIHKDLVSDINKKNGMRSKQKRYTGCPPALNGKDVCPLPLANRKYPRRTKSPTPQPGKAVQKIHPSLELGKSSSSVKTGLCRYSEPAGASTISSRKYSSAVAERKSPMDREVSLAQSGVWPSEAERYCLSNRFRNRPQMDFIEPSTKRQKYIGCALREAERADPPCLRAGDVYSHLPPSVRSGKAVAEGSTTSDLPLKAPPPPASGSSANTDWKVINILRSYSPSDLASLYHPVVSSNLGVPSSPNLGVPSSPTTGLNNAENSLHPPSTVDSSTGRKV